VIDFLAKYLLLLLLLLPFIALTTDALKKTQSRMLVAVAGVVVISVFVVLATGDLGQHPNVADVFACAFFAWPIALLAAKARNPLLKWFDIWTSVPLMSWYLVNMVTWFAPSSNGFGAMLNLIAGGLYMPIIFAPLFGVFVGIKAMIHHLKSTPR
jgi:hypothetical protein